MNKLKLLIAEDSKIIQRFYKTNLSDSDYEIHFADNGEDALRIYNSLNPDIVILDIAMPVMSGFEVLKKIRQNVPVAKETQSESEKKVAVIIMATGMGSKEDIMDCSKLGINGYLVKPFSASTLQDSIMNYYLKVYPKKSDS